MGFYPGSFEEFLTAGVLAFILTFVRIGTAIMIMPGLGDYFVPERIRLHIAIGITFVLFPLALPHMPKPFPGTFMLLFLIVTEFTVGVFFGMIARILMLALDTAGMVISISSGLANAQLFNPALATQGSLMGAFLSVTGVMFLFVTNLHHLLIRGIVESYDLFPLGGALDTGSMAELMARMVAKSFTVGVQIGMPFVVLSLLVYIVMGVLARLMPQVQVFLLALPVQIILSLSLLMMTLGVGFMYWAAQFEDGMVFFLAAVRP